MFCYYHRVYSMPSLGWEREVDLHAAIVQVAIICTTFHCIKTLELTILSVDPGQRMTPLWLIWLINIATMAKKHRSIFDEIEELRAKTTVTWPSSSCLQILTTFGNRKFLLIIKIGTVWRWDEFKWCFARVLTSGSDADSGNVSNSEIVFMTLLLIGWLPLHSTQRPFSKRPNGNWCLLHVWCT